MLQQFTEQCSLAEWNEAALLCPNTRPFKETNFSFMQNYSSSKGVKRSEGTYFDRRAQNDGKTDIKSVYEENYTPLKFIAYPKKTNTHSERKRLPLNV